MDDLVAIALAAAVRQGTIGTILHLGAGTGQMLDAWVASAAARIVLVEPNPQLAARLEERAADDARITVRACALAAQDGQALLRVFNQKSLSSLRAPQELAQLFSGLRDVADLTVTTVTLDSLLADLPPASPDTSDIMIIDTPGEEATAVAALIARPDRHRFAAVLLSCGTTAHYEGSESIATLRATLQAAGYRLDATDDSDPDRPLMVLQLDRIALENTRSRAQLVEQSAMLGTQEVRLTEMSATLVARDAQIWDLGAGHATDLAARDTRVVELQTAHAATLAARDTKISELQTAHATALAEQDAKIAARDAAQTALTQDCDRQIAMAEERKTRIETLDQRIKELEHKQQLARNELRRSEGQIDLIKDLLLREGGL